MKLKKQQYLKNNVFPCTIGYQLGGNVEDLTKFGKELKLIREDEKGILEDISRHANGCCYCFDSSSIIWVPKKMSKRRWREIMTHESMHATLNAMVGIGMQVSSQELDMDSGFDEPFCYFQQYMLDEFGVFK